MTHKMKFYIDRYGIHVEPVCEAPEGSDCRLICDEHCESWVVERNEHGVFHRVWDDIGGTLTEERHLMVDSGECNICLWLNDDPTLIPELYDGKELVIGEREIVPVWQGLEEGYLWKEKE